MPPILKKFLRELDNGNARDIYDWLDEANTANACVLKVNDLMDEIWDSHPETFPD